MSLKDFELGKELGKGAFGSVCIAKRKEDGKTYAMKRVKISSLSPKEGEYALNEIRILASLSHSNIIGYKEAFFDEPSKTLNIVMEYADDGDIASKITKNSKSHLVFQESTIWLWLIQILEGLKYLHDNKIMHRDLKSANIFLMKKGMLKLGDLNVSKLVKMGMAQTQTGTPYYCSPEIWLDKPYNYKSDIWSVGCIVYELATLKPPFQGTSLKDLSRNIIKGQYDPISLIYSRDLSKIISKMLIVDPNFRMSTDQLLKDDIILKKIEEYKASIDFLGNKDEKKAQMINTIKLPKNLREINKALPKKQYCSKNIEMEMMENDEYETQKTGFNHGLIINHNSNVIVKEQQQGKEVEKMNKDRNSNLIIPGCKPIIKDSNEKQLINSNNNKQIINNNKNNYIDVFLQKDRDNQLSEKNKDAYYYKHCINPFIKEDQSNDKYSPIKYQNANIKAVKNNNNPKTPIEERNKIESERPVSTNPNQPPSQQLHQRENLIKKNNNNKSPLVDKRPKSSQQRASKCIPGHDIVSSPPNSHKGKPPSGVKPVIAKPQIIKPQKHNSEKKGISPGHVIYHYPKDIKENNQPINPKHQKKEQIVHFRN